jgi:uncharacterized protein (TIGR02757 family)
MKNLKQILDNLYATYSYEYIDTDPILFPHRFKSYENIEIASLISALLAYGNVKQIKKSLAKIFNIMGEDPYFFVKNFDPNKNYFNGFVHRFNTGEDISQLIHSIKIIYNKYGNIKNLFFNNYDPNADNLNAALDKFTKNVLKIVCRDTARLVPTGFRYFFPTPFDGSPCKRLNLFLRWMVRSDKVDFGLWKEIPTNKLIIPLDTHIFRISKNLGLTKLNSPNLKACLEITKNLKKFDPADPVKYDFSLTRLGILYKNNLKHEVLLKKYKGKVLITQPKGCGYH